MNECEECESIRTKLGDEVFAWFLRVAEHKATKEVESHSNAYAHEITDY